MLTLDKSRLHIKAVLKRKQDRLLYNNKGTSQQKNNVFRYFNYGITYIYEANITDLQ